MYQIYQLNMGETLESVAKKIGIDISELRRLNGIGDNAVVSVGSYIVIPKEKENKKFNTYIVKRGDTIYEIARANGIDYNTLLAINGLNVNDYIYPEQEILIPNVRVYVTKERETIGEIQEKLNLDLDKIKDLYLISDQTIYY